MGQLWEDTHVTLLVADYASADPSGKINMIGAGFAIAGFDPVLSTTAPMHVALMMDIDPKHAGEQFSYVLELRNIDTDDVVSVPSGPLGQPDALRVTQMATVQRPVVPGVPLPDKVLCRTQLTLGFPTGLPLAPGYRYAWRLTIDGNRRKHWRAAFFVPELPQGPVFGGPAGPSDIPGVQRPDEEHEDD